MSKEKKSDNKAEKKDVEETEEVVEKITEEVESSKEDNEIEALKKELEEKNDLFMRIRAEYDNFRKRTQQEKTALYNNAIADAVSAILPAIDNIDRAVSQDMSTEEDMKKGLDMISGQINASLSQLGVTTIGEKGEEFDPNLHNAVSHIDDDSLGDNVIAEVLQKGYILGDRVVRHAVVQVAN